MEDKTTKLIAVTAQIKVLEKERNALMHEIQRLKDDILCERLRDLAPVKKIVEKYKRIHPDRWFHHETTALSYYGSTCVSRNFPEFVELFSDHDYHRKPAVILLKNVTLTQEEIDILNPYEIAPTKVIVHSPGGN